jgi:hypothetical protein
MQEIIQKIFKLIRLNLYKFVLHVIIINYIRIK